MGSELKFSVVMPTYNSEKFLVEAIDSVLDQEYENWELLVVDNFSTDESLTMLNQYSDSRIKVLRFRNNGVIAASRNVAISKAEGQVIAFLDSDDRWLPKKLGEVAEAFALGADFVYHNVETINEKSERIGSIESRALDRNAFLDLATTGNFIVNSSVCVSTTCLSLVNGLSEKTEHIGIEDFNAWLKIASRGFRFVHIPITLGSYRVHDSNHSGSIQEPDIPIAAYSDVKNLLTQENMDEIYRNFNFFHGVRALERKNFSQAIHFFGSAKLHKSSAGDLKTMIRLFQARLYKFLLNAKDE